MSDQQQYEAERDKALQEAERIIAQAAIRPLFQCEVEFLKALIGGMK